MYLVFANIRSATINVADGIIKFNKNNHLISILDNLRHYQFVDGSFNPRSIIPAATCTMTVGVIFDL
jgi:hypothetical protein